MGCAPTDGQMPDTFFAPAERVADDVIRDQHARFVSDPILSWMLEALPLPAAVLNRQRQAIAANRLALAALGSADGSDLLGRRPGEILGCVEAAKAPNGCGTGVGCRFCGAVDAIVTSLRNEQTILRECRIRTSGEADGGALDLAVEATYVAAPDGGATVLTWRDISSEKRRRVLERTFFHDVLNTAGGIFGLSQILNEDVTPEEDIEFKHQLVSLAEQLVDQINAQRQLLAAETGELAVSLDDVAIPDLLRGVVSLYAHHAVADNRGLVIEQAPAEVITTDRVLLHRVLGNLIKNALEATPAGGQVTVRAFLDGPRVLFAVHNPTVMPPAVQAQLFQRSFSTKGGSGRGVGTFSVLLLTTRYLAGDVSFTSEEPAGTTFVVSVPRVLRPAPA